MDHSAGTFMGKTNTEVSLSANFRYKHSLCLQTLDIGTLLDLQTFDNNFYWIHKH